MARPPKRVSDLSPAGPLTGGEFFSIVQNGQSVRIGIAELRAWLGITVDTTPVLSLSDGSVLQLSDGSLLSLNG